MKLVPITFAVAFLLAGCGSTTPTSPPPSPAGSHVARVDTSAPVVNGVQAPPSSGDPAPSESAAPQPTPTPDPDPVRTAAATGFQADGVDNLGQCSQRQLSPNDVGPRDEAAALGPVHSRRSKQAPGHLPTRRRPCTGLRPAKVTRLQALLGEPASAFAAGRMARFYDVAGETAKQHPEHGGACCRPSPDRPRPSATPVPPSRPALA